MSRSTITLAAVLWLLHAAFSLPMNVRARWPLGLFVTAVGTLNGQVNVCLGVHWPSDVLGGYARALLLLTPIIAAERLLAARQS